MLGTVSKILAMNKEGIHYKLNNSILLYNWIKYLLSNREFNHSTVSRASQVWNELNIRSNCEYNEKITKISLYFQQKNTQTFSYKKKKSYDIILLPIKSSSILNENHYRRRRNLTAGSSFSHTNSSEWSIAQVLPSCSLQRWTGWDGDGCCARSTAPDVPRTVPEDNLCVISFNNAGPLAVAKIQRAHGRNHPFMCVISEENGWPRSPNK